MGKAKAKRTVPLVEELMAKSSLVLSKAHAFQTMGMGEAAQTLWVSAASVQERIAPLLDAEGETLEAAVYRMSAASCYEKASDPNRAVNLYQAALAGPLREGTRKEVEGMLAACLARLKAASSARKTRRVARPRNARSRPDQQSASISSLFDHPIRKADWRKGVGERNGTSTAPARLHGSNGEQKTASDAGPWEPAVQKMVAFQHLGDDWDSQGARAPSYELLESAIGLAYTLYQKEVDPPHFVVPGLNGSVTFEWHDPDGTYTEVEIVRPFYAEVMMIEPGKPARHWTLPTE